MGVQSFLPRRNVVVVKQSMIGYYATATAQLQGVMAVQASSFFEPFNTVGIPIGTTGANKSNITLNPNFSAGQSPIGYSELNALYQYYKVRKARLRVRALAGASVDVFQMALQPSTVQASTAQIVTSTANPYAKNAMVTSSARPTEITIECSGPQILGYSATQFEGLTPALFAAAPGASGQWFFNFSWCMQTTTNATQPLFFEFDIWQEVEVSLLEEFSS